jgi:MFS transporter, putative metabolite:H+ symporter
MTDRIAARSDFALAARIERLPISSWHAWIGIVICTGFFFDAFDIQSLAYAMPVLVKPWHLAPGAIGAALSVGFVGQIFGAVFFGWLGERIGRVPAMFATILGFSVMSLGCAFAWDLHSMMALRFIQGLFLGGAIPVLATYLNEFAASGRRGRFVLAYQCAFPIGLPMTAWLGNLVVPSLGWQWMFVIGALPGALILPFARLLPESPRWLASRGRHEEADRVMTRIEAIVSRGGTRPLPPLPADLPVVPRADTHLGDLFRGIYLRRTLTVWALWFCTYTIIFGMLTWMPTVWVTVYHLPTAVAYSYQSTYSLIAAPGFLLTIGLIDLIGRRRMFLLGLGLGGLLMLSLGLHPGASPMLLLIMTASTQLTVGMLALALSTYTAEIYPTELRSLGSGVGNAWQRIGSAAGPAFIGAILPAFGLSAVFLAFGVLLWVGCLVCFLFAIETRGRVLEQLSPSHVRRVEPVPVPMTGRVGRA